jgi:hypothetical protein
MKPSDLTTKQAKSMYLIISEAMRAGDTRRLSDIESDLMKLQDHFDTLNIKRFDRIMHSFDFKPSRSLAS